MHFFNTTDKKLLLVLALYLALGVILLGYYQHQINPDGVGYIQTAEKYLGGDIYNALNAYWGPLFSWLLIPFLSFNQNPAFALLSSKILSLIIGFITLIGVRQLSYRFEMDESLRTAILLIMVPVLIYFAYSVITPDLLTTCILIFYFSIIFNPKYPDNLSNGFFCGFLGALAFLGKSYMFPFFIVQFFILNLLHYLGEYPRVKVTRNMGLGFLVFLLISGVWIGLISSKEDKLTFGTSGEYNHALVGPESSGFPQFSQGLSAPGEINQEKALKGWSPFDSWGNFTYQLTLIWNNFWHTISIFQFFSFLSVLIIICSLLLLFPPLSKYTSSNQATLFILVTILIYSAGYLPVLVEDRYLWPVYILLIMLGGFLISLSFKKLEIQHLNILKGVVLIIFAASFVFMPINFLSTNLNTGEDIYSLSNILKSDYGVNGNIATNDRLIDTQYLSFYLNTSFFGQSRKGIPDQELEGQLVKYGINYYFVWGSSSPYLTGYTEITGVNIRGLKIYRKNS